MNEHTPKASRGNSPVASTSLFAELRVWTYDLAWSRFQKVAYVALTLGAIWTTLYILRTSIPNVLHHGFAAGAPILPTMPSFNFGILSIHIASAIPPLLIGAFEFSSAARRASIKAHRILGQIYCVTIWISAITGFMLACANTGGWLAKAGFGTLAIVWFTTTTKAYLTVRNKDFAAHRNWMIRSYAVTLAVVSVRPMYLLVPELDLPREVWYPAITWLCWVPNLLIAELYLRNTLYSGRLVILKRRARKAAVSSRSALSRLKRYLWPAQAAAN